MPSRRAVAVKEISWPSARVSVQIEEVIDGEFSEAQAAGASSRKYSRNGNRLAGSISALGRNYPEAIKAVQAGGSPAISNREPEQRRNTSIPSPANNDLKSDSCILKVVASRRG